MAKTKKTPHRPKKDSGYDLLRKLIREYEKHNGKITGIDAGTTDYGVVKANLDIPVDKQQIAAQIDSLLGMLRGTDAS